MPASKPSFKRDLSERSAASLRARDAKTRQGAHNRRDKRTQKMAKGLGGLPG